MKKQIQVRIYPNGKIEAKTIGVKGKHCVQYSSLLEQVLNARVVESQLTDEYYQQEEIYNEINESNQITINE